MSGCVFEVAIFTIFQMQEVLLLRRPLGTDCVLCAGSAMGFRMQAFWRQSDMKNMKCMCHIFSSETVLVRPFEPPQ